MTTSHTISPGHVFRNIGADFWNLLKSKQAEQKVPDFGVPPSVYCLVRDSSWQMLKQFQGEDFLWNNHGQLKYELNNFDEILECSFVSSMNQKTSPLIKMIERKSAVFHLSGGGCHSFFSGNLMPRS